MEDHEIRVPRTGERYEHYRGGTFEVITVGRLSEQRDQIMVVYRSLDRGHVWIRPLGMWSEYVEWRQPSCDGVFHLECRAPRFKLVT